MQATQKQEYARKMPQHGNHGEPEDWCEDKGCLKRRKNVGTEGTRKVWGGEGGVGREKTPRT